MKYQQICTAMGIVGILAITFIGIYPRNTVSHAEYCAEELVSRKPVEGRLVESRSCKSWVGWPIEIREVKQ